MWATAGAAQFWLGTFTHLQVVPEHLVIELGDLELVGLLPVHDPGAALALGVHHDWVAGGAGDHDAVLNTELVCGQALHSMGARVTDRAVPAHALKGRKGGPSACT